MVIATSSVHGGLQPVAAEPNNDWGEGLGQAGETFYLINYS